MPGPAPTFNQFAVGDLLKPTPEIYKPPITAGSVNFDVPISGHGNINFPYSYSKNKAPDNPIGNNLRALFNSGPTEKFMTSTIKYNADEIDAARYVTSPDYLKLGISLNGNNEERYGQNQSWSEVLSNGLSGMGKLAANGFVDGWKQWGRTFDALTHWDWNKLHGDAESMLELDNNLKDIMNSNPIYATKESTETFWNRQMFGNFLQQSGFTVGALAQVASEQLLTKVIEAGLTTTGIGAGGAAQLELVTDIKSAGTLARIGNFFNKSKEFFNVSKTIKNIKKLGDIWKDEAIVKNFATTIGQKIPGVDIAMDINKVYKTGKEAGLTGTQLAGDIAKIGFGGLKRTMSEANFAFTEARMEAAGTFTDLYNQMQDEHFKRTGVYAEDKDLQNMQNIAMKAADKNFNFNSAVLAISNRIMFDNVFKNSKLTSKILSQYGEDLGEKGFRVLGKINGKKTSQYYTGNIFSNYKTIAADFGTRKAKTVLGKSIMKSFLKFDALEGIQELLQEGSNEYYKDYYLNSYKATYNPDIKVSSEESLDKAISSQMTMQGLKTFASGALTGMLIHGPTVLLGKAGKKLSEKVSDTYKTSNFTKEEKEKYFEEKKASKDELKNYYNEFNAIAKDPSKLFSESIKNFNVQKEGASALDEAAKLGDKFGYENIRTDMLHSMVSQAVRNDTHEALVDTLREYGKHMSKEEFEQAFVGLDYTSENKKTTADYTEKVAKSIESYAKIYNKLQEKYGSRVNPNRYAKGSEKYYREAHKKQVLNNMIDILAGNEFKSVDAIERSLDLYTKATSHKTLGSSLASAYNILGSEGNIKKEMSVLDLDIETKNEQLKSDDLTKDAKDKLKTEIKLKEQQKESLQEWLDNKDDLSDKPKLTKSYEAFKNYLELKNKEFGKDITVNINEVEDLFLEFNDYIKLNKKSQEHVDAINMLSNPKYFNQVYERMEEGADLAYFQLLQESANEQIKAGLVNPNEHFIIESGGRYAIFTPSGQIITIVDSIDTARKIKEKLNKSTVSKDDVEKLVKESKVKKEEEKEEEEEEEEEEEKTKKKEEKKKEPAKEKKNNKILVEGKVAELISYETVMEDGKEVTIVSYRFVNDPEKSINQFSIIDGKKIDTDTGEEITVSPIDAKEKPVDKSTDEQAETLKIIKNELQYSIKQLEKQFQDRVDALVANGATETEAKKIALQETSKKDINALEKLKAELAALEEQPTSTSTPKLTKEELKKSNPEFFNKDGNISIADMSNDTFIKFMSGVIFDLKDEIESNNSPYTVIQSLVDSLGLNMGGASTLLLAASEETKNYLKEIYNFYQNSRDGENYWRSKIEEDFKKAGIQKEIDWINRAVTRNNITTFKKIDSLSLDEYLKIKLGFSFLHQYPNEQRFYTDFKFNPETNQTLFRMPSKQVLDDFKEIYKIFTSRNVLKYSEINEKFLKLENFKNLSEEELIDLYNTKNLTLDNFNSVKNESTVEEQPVSTPKLTKEEALENLKEIFKENAFLYDERELPNIDINKFNTTAVDLYNVAKNILTEQELNKVLEKLSISDVNNLPLNKAIELSLGLKGVLLSRENISDKVNLARGFSDKSNYDYLINNIPFNDKFIIVTEDSLKRNQNQSKFILKFVSKLKDNNVGSISNVAYEGHIIQVDYGTAEQPVTSTESEEEKIVKTKSIKEIGLQNISVSATAYGNKPLIINGKKDYDDRKLLMQDKRDFKDKFYFTTFPSRNNKTQIIAYIKDNNLDHRDGGYIALHLENAVPDDIDFKEIQNLLTNIQNGIKELVKKGSSSSDTNRYNLDTVTNKILEIINNHIANTPDKVETKTEETEDNDNDTIDDIDQTFDDIKKVIDEASLEADKIFQVGLRQTEPALSLGNTTHFVKTIEIEPGRERFERGEINKTYEFEIATPTFMPGKSVTLKVDEFDGVNYDDANIGIYTIINNKETRIGAVHTPQWIAEQRGSNNAYSHIVIPETEINDKFPKTLEKELEINESLRKLILDNHKNNPNFVLNGTIDDKSIGIIVTMNELGTLTERLNPEIGKGGLENRHGMFGIVRNGSIQTAKGYTLDFSKMAPVKSFSPENISQYDGYSVMLIPTPTGSYFPTFIKLPNVAREQSEFILKAWKVFTKKETDADLVQKVYEAVGKKYNEKKEISIDVLKSYIDHYITNLNSKSLSVLGNGEDAPDNVSRIDIFDDGNIKIQGKLNGKWLNKTIKKGEEVPSDILDYMDNLITTVRFTNDKNKSLLGINSTNRIDILGVKNNKLYSKKMTYNQYIMEGAKTYLEKGIESKNKYNDWVYFANPVVKFKYTEPTIEEPLFNKDETKEQEPISKEVFKNEPEEDVFAQLERAIIANNISDAEVKEESKKCTGNPFADA